MGLVLLSSVVVGLGMMPFSGVISDRWNRKNALVVLDLLNGFILLALAYIAFKNRLTLELLIVTTMIRSAIGALFQTSSSAILVDIADQDNLRSVNSIARTLNSVSSLAGPAIGGVLYGFFGITIILFVNAISFILSGISEMFIQYKYNPSHSERLSVKTFFTEFNEGIKAIKTIKGLFVMLLFTALLNMIDAPIIPIFLPFVGKQVLGFSATNIGLITSAYTFGALISGLVMATALKKTDSKKLFNFGIITAPLFQIVFAFMIFPKTLALITSTVTVSVFSLVLYFMMGFSDSFVNIPVYTKIQMIIPEEVRGRVFSIMSILSSVFMPLGYLIYGFLLDNTTPHYLLLGVSVITLIFSLVLKRFIPWESFPDFITKNDESGTTALAGQDAPLDPEDF
jgi:MFS family permease